jgi:hypothetical protein
MGKNTPDRQQFIINNLKIEEDLEDEDLEEVEGIDGELEEELN